MRRRRTPPPWTYCRECGRRRRSFTPGALCGVCLAAIRDDRGETLREWRKRVIGS